MRTHIYTTEACHTDRQRDPEIETGRIGKRGGERCWKYTKQIYRAIWFNLPNQNKGPIHFRTVCAHWVQASVIDMHVWVLRCFCYVSVCLRTTHKHTVERTKKSIPLKSKSLWSWFIPTTFIRENGGFFLGKSTEWRISSSSHLSSVPIALWVVGFHI